MSRVDPEKFHYFSPQEGRVVTRYGSGAKSYIGARFEEGKGVVVDPNAVVRIPDIAYLKHYKAFQRAIKDESLLVRTQADYDAYVKKVAEAANAEAKTKAKEKAKAAKASEAAARAESENEDEEEEQ